MATSKPAAASTESTPLTAQEQVFDILSEAQDKCNAILEGSRHSLLSITVNNALNQLKIRFRTINRSNAGNGNRKQFKPLTPRKLDEVETPSPKTLLGEELAVEVDGIYETFVSRENDEILDSLNDLQIRGVAKKAGIQVTETSPENVTNYAFLDEIKDAIQKKAEVALVSENPDQALKDKITATEAALSKLSEEKSGIESALETETGKAKRSSLEKQLAVLTEKESELYSLLDQLNQDSESNNTEDQDGDQN